MNELTRFECKCCGAPLDVRGAQEGVLRCPYCTTLWTLPRQETSTAALQFLRMGEHDLDTCKFDDALAAYTKAAEFDPKEPEVYFGMALAQFKVQYLKDEVNNCLQPICHEISEKVFTEDKNYKKALELATVEQKKVYRKKGGEIDDIRDEFFALQKSGSIYDCFICVKVTEEDGSLTKDRERASMIYEHLKDNGYHPFFSERDMKQRTGSAYEALILYALYTSECMLIVCSNEDYLQTKWVKNEYTRFINLMQEGGKERDALTFVFCGRPIEKLPSGKKIQGIDLAKPDAYSRITQYVKNHTVAAKKQRELDSVAAREQEAAWRRRIEEKNRQMEEIQKKQLQALKSEVEKVTKGVRSTIGDKLTRAWQEMDARDFSRAQNYFMSVLDSDPQNVEAWRGMFLADFRVTSEEALLTHMMTSIYVKSVLENKNLKNFLHYKTENQYDEIYSKIESTAKAILVSEKAKHQKTISKCKVSIAIRRVFKILFSLLIGVVTFFISYFVIPSLLSVVFSSEIRFNIYFCIAASAIIALVVMFALRQSISIGHSKSNMRSERQTVAELNSLLKSFEEIFHQ